MIENFIRRFGAHLFLTVLFGIFAFLIYFSIVILPNPSFSGALGFNIGIIGCFFIFLAVMRGEVRYIQEWINKYLDKL